PVNDSIADVAIIGGGIVGLFNALSLAKRGLDVVLIDNLAGNKRSYKVGESFLIFTNPFLRVLGELDGFLHQCFPKHGVWFTHGMEHTMDFGPTAEWAVQADPPEWLYEQAEDKLLFRSMFNDVQIVRPEAEDAMREALRKYDNVKILDTAKAREVSLGEGDAPHAVDWQCQATQETGRTNARWLLDCSGRNRVLAKKFGHAAEATEMADDFRTTAVWGQFEGVADEVFEPPWTYEHKDGDRSLRDLYTLHLWGKGYWIWVIRLSDQRISVGVTFDQRRPPAGKTPKEQFWDVIRRYPILEKVLSEDRMLEFRMFRECQHMTDTFVSARRYAMAGDAASIIDAYYSQGVSLALVTSWHFANIVEKHVREGELDRAYIDHVNRATRQDWHIMRNMVREKYTDAIEDSRFFILSHLLDLSIFWSVGDNRSALVRWMVETGGFTSRETKEHRAVRDRLSRRLYYSQITPFHRLSPETVQRLQSRLQAGIGERARWRVAHGVRVPSLKAIVRLTAPTPHIWKMPFVGAEGADLSPHDVVDARRFEALKKVPALGRLLGTPMERLRKVVQVRGPALMGLFAAAYAYDWADTAWEKLKVRLTSSTRVPAPGDLPRDAAPHPADAAPRAGAGVSAASIAT
ncbi:MAG: FAD-dependent oxidoreductase, partial [Byssovorax sp.]